MFGDVNLSGVAQHAVDESHNIDWSSATVIDGPLISTKGACALEHGMSDPRTALGIEIQAPCPRGTTL